MDNKYLLTGGSGFLGSLLAIELVKRGDDVILLGRGKNGISFEKRIIELYKKIEPKIDLSKIKTAETDLEQEDLGIDLKKFSHEKLAGFWHIAADLSFKLRDRKKVLTTNVNGVVNVLNVCKKLNCHLYYISTAFVHGKKSGLIEEKIQSPRKFNNSYEESKNLAEKIIEEWRASNKINYTIFRPSILVTTTTKSKSYFGYYNVIDSLKKWDKRKKKRRSIFFFPFYDFANINLMPVEIAIDWILKIAECQRSNNMIFNITNPFPLRSGEVAKKAFAALGIKIIAFKATKSIILAYFNLLYMASFIFPAFRGISKKFYYYKYYLIQNNSYSQNNTKYILGKKIVQQTCLSINQIDKITNDFLSE